MEAPLPLLLAAATGFALWGGVEYLVHGGLSHRWRTPIGPIHGMHHLEPRAVFTSPLAWMPVALIVGTVACVALGPALGLAGSAGLLAGFFRYEYVHWRIHFRAARNERERRLRQHHLAHHFVRPDQYHGVTTRLWDRLFGTLPETWPRDYARADVHPPLQGSSNYAALYASGALGAVRRARRQGRAVREARRPEQP